ncbi:MAG: polyphosphate kinase [Methanomassiliicoccales archaeon PtaB.Bin215]|nr:MAG: polyphosphate kinase [Methanomassiliicoccales archaeon PtaB.Bin215]
MPARKSSADRKTSVHKSRTKKQSGDSPFINREISWVRFHKRILEEAQDTSHPLLERVKFLAICGSNLDEFFMVRVSGLKRQLKKGALEAPPDGLTPLEQLEAISEELLPLLEAHGKLWYVDLLPKLRTAGITIHPVKDLETDKRQALRDYFERMIFPALTPLALDFNQPFPFISNLSINLAVSVRHPQRGDRYARVKVPLDLFPRFVPIPGSTPGKLQDFVLLEDLVADNLDLLFPGMKVRDVHLFRITRDADIEITTDEAEDLLTAIEESVETRRVGSPIRLEVDNDMPEKMVDLFATKLGLHPLMVFRSHAPLSLVGFWDLLSLNRPDLKDPPFLPYVPSDLVPEKSLMAAVEHRDRLFYHPYDSFVPMVTFLKQAANDPQVLAIKITLYRIDKHSPIIDALMEARENGKAVAAVVELKARFDEENNIVWARALENAGVHVVYGLMDLKVHAKLLLVVRKKGDSIVRYSHMSSGNYNAQTSRIYGDIGYLTADPDIGADVADLFNYLTGYSHKESYRRLLVAPVALKKEMIARIDREAARHKEHGDGYLAFKLNGLLDPDVIDALYRASQVGVRIDLNVRGLCALRPGVKGLSDNIKVNSIVGRFLEHARIYYFRNGGEEEVFLGSSDMMPRNLKRRVEVLFPVLDEQYRRRLVDEILPIHLKDNAKSRDMLPDGTYVKRKIAKGEERVDSQAWLIKNRGSWHREE